MLGAVKDSGIARMAIPITIGAIVFAPFASVVSSVPTNPRGPVEELVFNSQRYGSIFWIPSLLSLVSAVFIVKNAKEGALAGYISIFLGGAISVYVVYGYVHGYPPSSGDGELSRLVSMASYSFLGLIGGGVGGTVRARRAKRPQVMR